MIRSIIAYGDPVLKQKAENNTAIHGQGVLEILQDSQIL